MSVKQSGDYKTEFEEFKRLITSDDSILPCEHGDTEGEGEEEPAVRRKEIYAILAQLDPDAIGAARLFRRIANHFNRVVHIRFAGPLEHPQNEAIFNQFQLRKDIKPLTNIPEDAEVALLDSAMAKDARIGDIEFSPRYIVDHHRTMPEQPQGCWYFVEPFGSTCAILALMMQHFGITFVEGDDSATLGALGIISDTNFMLSSQTTQPDIEMIYWLMANGGSWASLRKAYAYKLPDEYFEILLTVLQNMRKHKSYLISNGGYLQERQGVFLAMISEDLLIRREGIATVVLWAICGDQIIVKSRCTSEARDDLDQWMKDKFGENRAGAKDFAGGGVVPLEFFAPNENNAETLLVLSEQTVMFRLFGKIDAVEDEVDKKASG